MWLHRSSSRWRIATVVQKPLECEATLRPGVDSAGLAGGGAEARRTTVSLGQRQSAPEGGQSHGRTVQEALHQQRGLNVLERRRPVGPVDLEHLLGARDEQAHEPARAPAHGRRRARARRVRRLLAVHRDDGVLCREGATTGVEGGQLASACRRGSWEGRTRELCAEGEDDGELDVRDGAGVNLGLEHALREHRHADVDDLAGRRQSAQGQSPGWRALGHVQPIGRGRRRTWK